MGRLPAAKLDIRGSSLHSPRARPWTPRVAQPAALLQRYHQQPHHEAFGPRAPRPSLGIPGGQGRTNAGNMFDQRGRLVSCEGSDSGHSGPGGRGLRRVVRTDMENGRIEVLTERFEGLTALQQSQRPSTIDGRGRIYFTESLATGTDRSWDCICPSGVPNCGLFAPATGMMRMAVNFPA